MRCDQQARKARFEGGSVRGGRAVSRAPSSCLDADEREVERKAPATACDKHVSFSSCGDMQEGDDLNE